jgi:long-chain fatty acid transport protein
MIKKILLLFVLIPLVKTANSQGFQVNFQGQKQQGMGCAGSANYTDGSSLFYNPGAVAFANESSVNVASTPVFANILYVDSATGAGYRTNSPVGTPFSAYGLFSLKKMEALKFGLAVYTPFGSTVQYEDNWIGRFALTRLKLMAIFIQPTISYRFTEKLGMGVGFVLSTGEVNLQKDIPVQDSLGNFAHAELSGKALGFGYNIGISYKATDALTLGLTYRSQVNMAVNTGQATFTVPSSLSSNFPNGTFSSSLPLPALATLGFAYTFNKKWKAVLDINYVGWRAYDTLAFDYATNTASLVDTKSARMYKNIMAFRGGVEHKITKDLDVRLGGGYGFSPVQNGYVTPETPDKNRAYFTAGLSYHFGTHFSIDASVYYTQIRRTDRNLETNLNGTFTTKAIAPGISFNYTW